MANRQTIPTFNHVIMRPLAELRPAQRNARTHSRKQLRQIADSITRFGFTNPVLISDDGEIIAGHGRVAAAKLLGVTAVPTITLSHLSAAGRRAYVLADNKLALNAGCDKELLAIELQGLIDLDFEVELTGFSLAEIDLIIDDAGEADPRQQDAAEDHVPLVASSGISKAGDLWLLGRHRLLCGDARSPLDMSRLMDGEEADMLFTDPPYNVKIDGNVCGLGSSRLRICIGRDEPGAVRDSLGLEMASLPKLKALIRACEADCRYWHKRAFPTGERVCFTPELRTFFKPLLKQSGLGSIAQLERYLEEQSGNPPRQTSWRGR